MVADLVDYLITWYYAFRPAHRTTLIGGMLGAAPPRPGSPPLLAPCIVKTKHHS